MRNPAHISELLTKVLADAAQACGKHGCELATEHEGPHRNTHYEWLEGKEGSSAKKIKQEQST
jgi:hypothetical protein